MNTSTLLGRPLLLLVVLAVSWAAAVPLQAASGSTHLSQDPNTFLEQHPSVARDLYPYLINSASNVKLTLERHVLSDLLNDYMTVHRIEEPQQQAEGEHQRTKRDTTVSGGVNGNINPYGHSVSGSGTLTHAFDDNHAVSGTVGGTISGLGSLDTLSASGGYHYSPRDDTTLSINAQRNWLPGGGTTTGAAATLENTFDNNGRHSLSGTLEANSHNIPGIDTFNSHRAEVNWNYSPAKDTTISFGAGSSRSPFGRDNFFGISGTHFFG